MHIIFKLSFFILLFSTLVFAEAPRITSAMTIQELNKLTASNGAAEDYFGSSVSISGDTAVVGAYHNAFGSAMIFERNQITGLFEQTAELNASDAEAWDNFGYSVSISGDTVVIGARYDDDSGSASGSAYIFEKPALGWAGTLTQNAKLTASDAAEMDYFGISVAISGDTVIIGSEEADIGSNNDAGSAYIFEKPASGWEGFLNEDAKLTASDRDTFNLFGCSVSISGDTVIVGAYLNDVGSAQSGSAYIFEKQGDAWIDAEETAKLTSSDATTGDNFGKNVSISGDTVIIGAHGDDDSGTTSGSAYIFEKQGDAWTNAEETAKLTASDGAESDYFAQSVSISEDTVIIGAHYDDDSSNNSGSVYIFKKPINGWIDAKESAKVTASDGAESDYFGWSVSISRETMIIGAMWDDDLGDKSGSAYIFKNTLTQNTIENKTDIIDINASDAEGDSITFSIVDGLDADDLSVDSVSGLLSFNNAPDFENPTDSDTDNIYDVMLKVTDFYNNSDTYKAFIRVSDVDYEGATPKAISFEELHKLGASVPEENAYFGYSVAISGDTAIVGAPGSNGGAGLAYIYEYQSESDTFILQAQLRASDYVSGQDDNFGTSVSISGDTVVIGAHQDDDSFTDSGSAYIFVKPSPEGWINDSSEDAKLTASDGAINDYFAQSLSISGNTIVAGSTGDGSAYVFEKPASGWAGSLNEDAKLTASDTDISDYFGRRVSISGNTVVIGAHLNDDTANNSGSAYIYEKPILGWKNQNNEDAKLTASDAAEDNYFGGSVAINGDTVVIGAYGNRSAYIFEKPISGWLGSLNENAKLTASDSIIGDYFSLTVAISGDTVVVGAYGDDDAGARSGSTYIFEKPASGWLGSLNENAKLTASDGAIDDLFGYSVAISGDTIIIGAYGDDDSYPLSGSAYIFKGKESNINPALIMYLLN